MCRRLLAQHVDVCGPGDKHGWIQLRFACFGYRDQDRKGENLRNGIRYGGFHNFAEPRTGAGTDSVRGDRRYLQHPRSIPGGRPGRSGGHDCLGYFLQIIDRLLTFADTKCVVVKMGTETKGVTSMEIIGVQK